MTERTDRQRAADATLRTAIEEVLAAYADGAEDPTLLTDYIVLTASQGFTDDGDPFVAHDWLLSDNSMPWYRILGLMDTVRTLMKHQIVTS